MDTEKSLDKMQYSFMVRTMSKLGLNGNFLNLLKGI